MAANTWALAHMSRLLPLDEESLKRILDYTSTLSKDAAAEHLKDLLGDSPQALEFIASFNARREALNYASPAVTADSLDDNGVPAVPRPMRKKKTAFNKLPEIRRLDHYGDTQGAYQKKAEQDYMPGASHQPQQRATPLSSSLSLKPTPDAVQEPKTVPPSSTITSLKLPPSAAGTLISDLPNVRSRSTTPKTSRSATPRSSTPTGKDAKARVSISGGTAMHGASSALSDLDSAIRTLELQTNPALSSADKTSARACECQATRHPLLATAPNCLSCGKIICVREGIGPCTFCSTPLLSSSQIQEMLQSLKEERGRERQAMNNAAHKRADISGSSAAGRPYLSPLPGNSPAASTTDLSDPSLAQAKAHKDRLLGFQAQNARRTHVIDEAADYEIPSAGTSQWASPVERAKQLKKQQQVLREQEWNAKPEHEKRKTVVSLDVVGGKVVKRYGKGEVEMPTRDPEEDVDELNSFEENQMAQGNKRDGGAFGKNPLLGSLIRPTWKPDKGERREMIGEVECDGTLGQKIRITKWRRVQDDNDDNEAMILDGGVYGGREAERLVEEEHAQG